MPVCRTTQPELRPVPGHPGHLDACHLDDATKEREATTLLETMLVETA